MSSTVPAKGTNARRSSAEQTKQALWRGTGTFSRKPLAASVAVMPGRLFAAATCGTIHLKEILNADGDTTARRIPRSPVGPCDIRTPDLVEWMNTVIALFLPVLQRAHRQRP
jgi:hypothetical protein